MCPLTPFVSPVTEHSQRNELLLPRRIGEVHHRPVVRPILSPFLEFVMRPVREEGKIDGWFEGSVWCNGRVLPLVLGHL